MCVYTQTCELRGCMLTHQQAKATDSTVEGGLWETGGGGRRVECGVWSVERGGWRVEGGGLRVEDRMVVVCVCEGGEWKKE